MSALRTLYKRCINLVTTGKTTIEPPGPVVSVVEMSGILMRQENGRRLPQGNINFERVKKAVDKAFKVPGVKAVALDINCPGGSPAQCELISSYIRGKASRHEVPVLAFANDVAASGGYWLMCAADELYVCKTSLVGSIGVVGNSFGFVEVLKRLGIERRLAKAGSNKISADPFSELTAQQKAIQEELMQSLHSSFISFVKDRRGSALKDPDTSDIFSGRVWTGIDAVSLGLADGIGTLHQVLEEKHGKDVRIENFGKAPVPWWTRVNEGGALVDWAAAWASPQRVVEGIADGLQARMMWGRYGL